MLFRSGRWGSCCLSGWTPAIGGASRKAHITPRIEPTFPSPLSPSSLSVSLYRPPPSLSVSLSLITSSLSHLYLLSFLVSAASKNSRRIRFLEQSPPSPSLILSCSRSLSLSTSPSLLLASGGMWRDLTRSSHVLPLRQCEILRTDCRTQTDNSDRRTRI